MIDWLLNEFPTWFTTGLYHILDVNGYDHMLFLWCLCIRYTLSSWKSVLLLITAFTIGHSITLITTTLGIRILPNPWVELAIAISIFTSAALPFFKNLGKSKTDFWTITEIHSTSVSYYGLALCFGLVHGMGFSTLLIELLGNQSEIALPLLGFNVGIEFGQLIFVLSILSTATLLKSIQLKIYNHFITLSLIAGILLSTLMFIDRIYQPTL